MDLKNIRVCVTGADGTLGHAIVKTLQERGCKNLIIATRETADLRSQAETKAFFSDTKPDYVFQIAANAAGIGYMSTHEIDMLQDNLLISFNVMHYAFENNCRHLLNVSSALIYPAEARLPLSEEEITHVNLNQLDTPYALAKATAMQLTRYYNREKGCHYVTVVPCNFFGPYAPFSGPRSQVVPSLISRFTQAREQNLPEVVVWGTGNACRELLSSRDVADACVFLAEKDDLFDVINIGRGEEYTIRQVAEIVKKVTGYTGRIVFDPSKPEGRIHMMLQTRRLRSLGWKPSMDLEESIRYAYDWYMENRSSTGVEQT